MEATGRGRTPAGLAILSGKLVFPAAYKLQQDVDRAKGAKEFNGVAVQPGPYVGDDQSQ